MRHRNDMYAGTGSCRIASRFSAAALALLAGACSRGTPPPLPQDDPGIRVPEGFAVGVFADRIGRARHLAVRDNGDVYVALASAREDGGGTVALRDADGDGHAERVEAFGAVTGTGVLVAGEWLYRSSNSAVYRWRLAPGELVPAGEPETVVDGFPEQRAHAAKSLALDDSGALYVNSGAPSNACQAQDRAAESPGQRPCPLLERGGGVWRFEGGRMGMTQLADGLRYATGLRNSVALAWNPAARALYAIPHGRDQLDAQWPGRFDTDDNAELPAEELHRLNEGLDAGWPYSYYDGRRRQRMLAPEYGGDGTTPAPPGRYAEPLLALPAHWAPNALVFYTGNAFPPHYRHGAFIAFHGSWNRGPRQQGGFNVVFVPFRGAEPAGGWEVFADGFAGTARIRNPDAARYRPTGLAVAPDGALLIADSRYGRIWRITYAGR